MKRRPDTTARTRSAGTYVHAGGRLVSPMHDAHVAHDTHVTVGNVLWTLTQNGSTAQARRWITAAGYELELQIWSGARIEGQEDLSWSQLFTAEDELSEAAAAKKRQLVASGWLEDIDATAR